MRIPIQSFDDPGLDVYTKLNESQLLHYYEPHGGLFIAESPNVIRRALDAGYEPISFLLDKKEDHGQTAALIEGCIDIPVYTDST